MRAGEIARALRGRPSGDGWLCRCPVPGHGQGRGDLDPSLLVREGHRAAVFTCFGGCDRADVADELKRLNLLDGQAQGRVTSNRGLVKAPTSVRTKIQRTEAKAIEVWQRARPIAGTLASNYLGCHRGLPPPYPSALRFTDAPIPCLVAAVQGSAGIVTAVQITRLDPTTGRKAALQNPRLTIGSLGDGAVRLSEADGVLGIAEGVEDALAATLLTGTPTWACLGAGRMHRVSIPPKVRELHIFADDDESGHAAADRFADVHRHRRIVLRYPPDGFKDWGEVAMERMPA